jgi:16S rRNA A1518/A1519 N6-dimethyltransferase RsmA/KsgA/DIM1 with predicted DNA glycosylase/AP lyase activity
MAVILDPEGEELRAVLEFLEAPKPPRVLEIGAGDGRLTFRYADRVSHVTAIDPDERDIVRAVDRLPEALRARIDFRAVSLEAYRPPADLPAFDAVLLSWSL